MPPLTRIARSAAVALSALALTACATTMTAGSHVDRALDFARYRTWNWGPADTLPTGDARLDANPFFLDHVQGAVEKGLAARKLKGPNPDAPALLIHFHASINQQIDVNGIDSRRGYCDNACTEGIVQYEAGTLVLDFIDAETNRLIWRGWAQDTVEGVLDNEDRMAKKIDEAVAKMLARLPPSL